MKRRRPLEEFIDDLRPLKKKLTYIEALKMISEEYTGDGVVPFVDIQIYMKAIFDARKLKGLSPCIDSSTNIDEDVGIVDHLQQSESVLREYSNISFIKNEKNGEKMLNGYLQLSFLDTPISFILKENENDDQFPLFLRIFKGDYEIYDGQVTFQILRKQFNKISLSVECDGLVCRSYESLTNFSHLDDGSLLYFPTKNEVFGEIFTNSIQEKAIRRKDCPGFHVKSKKYCSKCRECSRYMSNNTNVTFREESDLAKKTSGYFRDKDLLNTSIGKTLIDGYRNGKLSDSHPAIEFQVEQIKLMTSKGPQANNDFSKTPNTLRATIVEKLSPGEGLGGKWVDKPDGKVFDGNLIRPSDNVVSNYVRLFQYEPGTVEVPSEVTIMIWEAIGVTRGFDCIASDAVHGNSGFVQGKICGMDVIVGVHDYGASSSFFREIKTKFGKAFESADSGTRKKQLIGEFYNSMRWIESKEVQEIRFAEKANLFYNITQVNVDWREEPLIVQVPFVYHLESNTTNLEASFMFKSAVSFMYYKICEGKKKGLKSCQNMIIDSICTDSDSGTMKFYREEGKRTNDLYDFELPYLMDIPVVDCDGKSDIITVALLNDVDHLLKEIRRDWFKSSGLEGDKLIFWGTENKKNRKLGKIEVEWKPVTKRTVERVFHLEEINPSIVKMSSFKQNHLWPTGRENMRTSFSTVFFRKRAIRAVQHYVCDPFDECKNLDDQRIVEEKLKLRKVEGEGLVAFQEDWRRWRKLHSQDYASTPYDDYQLRRDTEFKCRMYLEMKKLPKLSLTKNCLRTDILKKAIRNNRSSTHLRGTRLSGGAKGFLPKSVGNTNPIEQSFAEIRDDKQGRNFNFKEFKRRNAINFLKKARGQVKKHQSYGYSDHISHNDILLSEETIQRMKLLEKEREKKWKQEMNLKIKDHFNILDVKEKSRCREKLFGKYLQHYKYRLGRVIKSAIGVCDCTRRGIISRDIKLLLTEPKKFDLLIHPKKEVVDMFWEIDCFIRKNFTPILVTSSVRYLQEMFRIKIKELYNGAFCVMWSGFCMESEKKIENDHRRRDVAFDVLVDRYVNGRVWNLLGNFGLRPKMDLQAWRDQKKFKRESDKKRKKKKRKKKKKKKKKRKKKKKNKNANPDPAQLSVNDDEDLDDDQ